MSQRSHPANSGSRPIAACSAACSAPGTRLSQMPGGQQRVQGDGVPDGPGVQGVPRHVQADDVDQLPVRPPPQVTDHLLGDLDRAEPDPHPAAETALPWVVATRPVIDTVDVERAIVVQSGRSGRTSATPCVQVEVLHDVALAAMQVHRAGMHRRRRPVQVHRAEQPAGVLVDDRDLTAAAAAQVDPVGGMPRLGPELAGGPAPQHPALDQIRPAPA